MRHHAPTVLLTLVILLACEPSPVEVKENQETPGAQGDAVATLVLVGGAGSLLQARFGFNRIGLLAGEVEASLREGALSVDLAALPPAGEVILDRVKLTGRSSYVALSLGLVSACVEFEDPAGEVRVLTSAPAYSECGPSTGPLRFDSGSLTLSFPEGQRFEPSSNARILLEIDASESLRFDEERRVWIFEPSIRSLPEAAAAEFVVHMTVATGSGRVAGDFDVFLVSERSTFRTHGRADTAGRLIFGHVWPGLYAAHISSAEGRRLQIDGLFPEVLRLGAPESADVVVSEVDDGSRVITSGMVFIPGNRTGADPIVVATRVPDFGVEVGRTVTVSLREVGRPESGCPEEGDCLRLVWAGDPTLPNRVVAPQNGLVMWLTAGDGLLTAGSEVAGATPVGLGDALREWNVVLAQSFPPAGQVGLELSVENLGAETKLLAWEIRVGPG